MRNKKRLVIAVFIIALIIAVRMILEPKESNPSFKGFNKDDIGKIKSELSATLMNIDEVSAFLAPKKIVLVGENHFVAEPQIYFTQILDKLNDKPIVLLLELSQDSQEEIDAYLSTGDEKHLQKVFENGHNLPLEYILKWAFDNKWRIKKVIAFDENSLHVLFNRIFLTDTRNETMAEKVYSSLKEFQDARILVYGGGMHILKNGRYRYDSDTRSPIFPRLKKMGVPENEIASVMLSGTDRFPLDSLWRTKGGIKLNSNLGNMPYEYFIDYPVFGIQKACEAYDLFINLGTLTEIRKAK